MIRDLYESHRDHPTKSSNPLPPLLANNGPSRFFQQKLSAWSSICLDLPRKELEAEKVVGRRRGCEKMKEIKVETR